MLLLDPFLILKRLSRGSHRVESVTKLVLVFQNPGLLYFKVVHFDVLVVDFGVLSKFADASSRRRCAAIFFDHISTLLGCLSHLERHDDLLLAKPLGQISPHIRKAV